MHKMTPLWQVMLLQWFNAFICPSETNQTPIIKRLFWDLKKVTDVLPGFVLNTALELEKTNFFFSWCEVIPFTVSVLALEWVQRRCISWERINLRDGSWGNLLIRSQTWRETHWNSATVPARLLSSTVLLWENGEARRCQSRPAKPLAGREDAAAQEDY